MEIGSWFPGRIDEVRVYRRALTAAEIAADMAVPIDGRQSFISSVTPASGPIGQTVTISGINFGASQGANVAAFNGTPSTVSTWSDTSIVTVVPSGASSGAIVVTRQGVASNGVMFTVNGPQISANVSPPP